MTFKWRGKPVFVRHRPQAEVDAVRAVDVSTLRHKETDEARTKVGGLFCAKCATCRATCACCSLPPAASLTSPPLFFPFRNQSGWWCLVSAPTWAASPLPTLASLAATFAPATALTTTHLAASARARPQKTSRCRSTPSKKRRTSSSLVKSDRSALDVHFYISSFF